MALGETEYVIHAVGREVAPAFTLNQIGKIAYKRARDGDRYQSLELATAQLMCALTMEAVLNHVGARVFAEDGQPATWAALERVRPAAKLAAVSERVRLNPDSSCFPFQDFGPIFRFRNLLAHARPELLGTDTVPPEAIDEDNRLLEDRVPELQTKWERMCDLQTAERWRDSVYAMTKVLCDSADCSNPVLLGNTASWSGSQVPVETDGSNPSIEQTGSR